MTRNEALGKIREWTMSDEYNVNDHEAMLKFFENELGMKQVKQVDVQTHQENVFRVHFVHGWD